MEPAFYRGDLLFLTNYKDEDIRVGDITVFKIQDRPIPIVHRVIKIHEQLVNIITQQCIIISTATFLTYIICYYLLLFAIIHKSF